MTNAIYKCPGCSREFESTSLSTIAHYWCERAFLTDEPSNPFPRRDHYANGHRMTKITARKLRRFCVDPETSVKNEGKNRKWRTVSSSAARCLPRLDIPISNAPNIEIDPPSDLISHILLPTVLVGIVLTSLFLAFTYIARDPS